MILDENLRSVVIHCGYEDGKAKPAGSGVEFCPGKVLTAKHVLNPDGQKPSKIEIGWWNGEKGDPPVYWEEADTEYWEDLEFDIAILTVSNRPNQEKYSFSRLQFFSDPLFSDQRFSGWGFPHKSYQEGQPYIHHIRAGGKLDSESGIYHLGESDIDADSGSGVSGSGLFVGSTLAAVLIQARECPKNLRAISVDWLKQNSQLFEDKMDDILRNTKTDLDDDLENALKESGLDKITTQNNEKFADWARSPKRDLIGKCLKTIYEILCKEDNSKDSLIGEYHKTAKLIVSRHFLLVGDLPVVKEKSQTYSYSSVLSVAEFIMAVHDKRAVSLHDLLADNPYGETRMNKAPPLSFSQYEKNRFSEVVTLLGNRLDFFLGNLKDPNKWELSEKGNKRDAIISKLETRKKLGKPSFYLTIDEDDHASDSIEKYVRDVHDQFGGYVPVVILRSGNESWKAYNDIAHTLVEILNLPANQ